MVGEALVCGVDRFSAWQGKEAKSWGDGIGEERVRFPVA